MASLVFGSAYTGSAQNVYQSLLADFSAALAEGDLAGYFSVQTASSSLYALRSLGSGLRYEFSGSFSYSDGFPTGGSQVTGVALKSASGALVVSLSGVSYSVESLVEVTQEEFDVVFDALPWTVTGSSGNDVFSASQGASVWSGGDGLDRGTFKGAAAGFTVSKSGSGYAVVDHTGVEGTVNLTGVERLEFADSKRALDLGLNQSGGNTVLLLGAVLGRDLMLSKKPLLGVALDLFDQGYSLHDLAGALMRLDIWTLLAGGNSSEQIASYLLRTVNGVAPDAATLAAAVQTLNTGVQGDLLAELAVTAANQVQVGLTGLAQSGLEYL
ncbi:MAG: hypothetical protein FGM55_06055 [Rhodoferax sp.]|nr:hypothetical protein [Rhodoferax sp.]